MSRTAQTGTFQRTVQAGKGAKFRILSPLDHWYSPILVVR
jgi:hypothetical protein